MMIKAMVRSIENEPDLASDDKMNLRGVQYLRALVEIPGTHATGVPTAALDIGRKTVGPLTSKDEAEYDKLSGRQNYDGLINMASRIMNCAGISNY